MLFGAMIKQMANIGHPNLQKRSGTETFAAFWHRHGEPGLAKMKEKVKTQVETSMF